MSSRRCPYEKCYLPKDNKKYFWQCAYLIVSLAVLLKDPVQFNFFSLFLFAFPVLLDLLNGEVKKGALSFLRGVFIVINSILCLFIVLGIFEVIVDTGTSFTVVETAMVFSSVEIKKVKLLFLLGPDLLIPGMYYVGAPCQKNMEALEEVKSIVGQNLKRSVN